ncbi:uncharacterized protein LOC130190502 [Pseudoliparis swirei]|uniref:uncharacterized protein LOC130190502 n=1 Tax=Pseudoliparis swirei TaxID=2059687 RepID=UPI0024BE2924|nr:uncharacterized protein LOC130190502 [Pseudoliparis swirei]
MESIQQLGVDVRSSVIISGVTNTSTDDEIIECLKRYGSIKKVCTVDDSTSVYYKNLIVEFESSSALAALEPLLPYTHPSRDVPNVIYSVNTFLEEYTATVGRSCTANYLNELRRLAREGGQSFEGVLKTMISRMSEELDEPEGSISDTGEPSVQILDSPEPQASGSAQPIPQTNPNRRRTVSLSQNDLYPPDVQRVVVEHIVRREDISSHSLAPLRLRSFSGRYPKPSNEVDYETWRSHIDLLLADPSLSPLQITRRILESLLSPAADVVKGLGPDSLPTIYLQVLDSAFATVQDGEELFARFLNTLQDPGEKPSAYLQRLQRNGISAVKRGGIEVRLLGYPLCIQGRWRATHEMDE